MTCRALIARATCGAYTHTEKAVRISRTVLNPSSSPSFKFNMLPNGWRGRSESPLLTSTKTKPLCLYASILRYNQRNRAVQVIRTAPKPSASHSFKFNMLPKGWRGRSESPLLTSTKTKPLCLYASILRYNQRNRAVRFIRAAPKSSASHSFKFNMLPKGWRGRSESPLLSTAKAKPL